MPKFTYNDMVRVKRHAEPGLGHGCAWIVGVFDERRGPYFDQFPPGVIYTIEFEDGSSTQVHEASLELAPHGVDECPPAVAASGGEQREA